MKLLQDFKQFFENIMEGPKIADPVFGPIYWDSYWWYVNRPFAPTGKEIGISIVTDGTEPDERHRSLYIEIENRYFLLKDEIVVALFETLTKEFEQSSRNLIGKCQREDLWEHLHHEGIGIEDAGSNPRKWYLSFYCEWSDCVYSIHMEDWCVAEIENIGG